MKNELLYYYHLDIDRIYQVNKVYKFTYNSSSYIFSPYLYDIEKLNENYKLSIYLLNSNLYCHQIVLNNNNELLTNIDNINYILIKVNIEDRKIEIEDLIYFKKKYQLNIQMFKKNIDLKSLWGRKIDYIENCLKDLMNVDIELLSAIYYHIGLAENAITYLDINGKSFNKMHVSHFRITPNTTLIELYNPINFMIDYSIRDISEYIKRTDDIEFIDSLMKFEFDIEEIILLISRILYPTFFFDVFEQYINKEIERKDLDNYIINIKKNEIKIKNIINRLSIIYNVEGIDWLLN